MLWSRHRLDGRVHPVWQRRTARMRSDAGQVAWWRGREWCCTSCERTSPLWRSVRVKDFRGDIAEAFFARTADGTIDSTDRGWIAMNSRARAETAATRYGSGMIEIDPVRSSTLNDPPYNRGWC